MTTRIVRWAFALVFAAVCLATTAKEEDVCAPTIRLVRSDNQDE
jgi:hypothetical protein